MRRYNREILVEVFYDLAKDCERVESNDKTQMVVIYENDDDSMFYAVINGNPNQVSGTDIHDVLPTGSLAGVRRFPDINAAQEYYSQRPSITNGDDDLFVGRIIEVSAYKQILKEYYLKRRDELKEILGYDND